MLHQECDGGKITECQFADDSALLASTRSGAEKATLTHQQTNSDFVLTVRIPKMKHMVTGRLVAEEDLEPIALEGEEIEAVSEFQYLGSLKASSGRMDVDIEQWVAKALRTFVAWRRAILLSKNLRLSTKRKL